MIPILAKSLTTLLRHFEQTFNSVNGRIQAGEQLGIQHRNHKSRAFNTDDAIHKALQRIFDTQLVPGYSRL